MATSRAVTTVVVLLALSALAVAGDFTIVDTGQDACFDSLFEITTPSPGDDFFGQDAQHDGAPPSYSISGDGLTVYDNNTGLTWQQGYVGKRNFAEAYSYVDTLNAQNFGGYDDWRLPTIKELYSLIDFRGIDPSGYTGTDTSGLTPFLDTTVFDFAFGDPNAGERIIDAQYWSSTEYVSTTMNGNHTVFGVNFADGRIKGYPSASPMGEMTQYVRYVRGNPNYGVNDFADNGDGTVTDQATGLMWSQADSGVGMDWPTALAWVQQKNDENHLGYNDWRLPNAKELQSIVDYTRSPATTGSPAIDPVFATTAITDEGGETNYPFFWTSTTHENLVAGDYAAYIAFGEALGWMTGPGGGLPVLMDVHGAGAQRSDPKTGDPADWPYGHGPQGDVIRILNYVRLVRDAAILLPGDIDGDGDVDLTDLAILASNYSTASGAGWEQGDFDADGAVTLTDLAILANNWGGSAGESTVGLEAVAASQEHMLPEPATACLLCLLAPMTLAKRRR